MTASFPNLSRKIYSKIYHAFSKTVPTTISTSYLMAQLGASKSSASIYLGDLKKIGFVNDDGTTSKLVHKWKMPETYAEACKEIANSVYPDELLEMAEGNADYSTVKSWFKAEGMNDSIAGQRATFFCVLFEGTPPEKIEATKTKKPKSATAIEKSAIAKISKSEDKNGKPKDNETKKLNISTTTASCKKKWFN